MSCKPDMRGYFGDWTRVMDKLEFFRVVNWLNSTNPSRICPSPNDIFRAFTLCSLRDCKAVFIGQDPYPRKGVATGILFGNRSDVPEEGLSPSLKVIKEAAVDYSIPHQELEFDNTLESWARQGILMLNSSLTCKVNDAGSHSLYWRAFTSKLLSNISQAKTGIVFVLFGNKAKSFKPYIDRRNNIVLETEHPSWYARTGTKLPCSLFLDISRCIKDNFGTGIVWYRDYNNKINSYEEKRNCINQMY